MALPRSLLRGLLRAAGRLEAAGASVGSEASRFVLPGGLPASGSASLKELVRHQFRYGAMLAPGPQVDALLDNGLQALQMANQRATALAAGSTEVTPLPTASPVVEEEEEVAVVKTSETRYSVGQVFRHRKYGYRGVVIAYDPVCRASPQWVAATGAASLPSGTDQPFYHCLVDIRDRPEAQVSYVAEDNIELLETPSVPLTPALLVQRVVAHPLINRYFADYRPLEGAYVPASAAVDSEESEDEDEGGVPPGSGRGRVGTQ